MVVAALTYVGTTYLVSHNAELGVGWTTVLRLMPLAPLALWIRSMARFFGRLDELQRNLQIKVWLFASIGALAVVALVNMLILNGFDLKPVGIVPIVSLVIVLWVAGSFIAVRRFR